MAERFPPEVVSVLRAAGWFEGRRVGDRDIERWERRVASTGHAAPMFPSVRAALYEFGRLTIGKQGPGRDLATMSVRFDPVYGEVTDDFEQMVGRSLYPLGDADGGACLLAMDESGNAYLNLTGDWAITGPSLDALLIRMLVGLNNPPGHEFFLDTD
jgi:hypothetical protein